LSLQLMAMIGEMYSMTERLQTTMEKVDERHEVGLQIVFTFPLCIVL